jgi:hypothetical protein
MKKFSIGLLLLTILFSCSKYDGDLSEMSADYSLTGSKSGGSSANGEGNPLEPGKITSGEWNDLNNWVFMDSLLNSQDYSKMPTYWKLFTNHRVSVKVVDSALKPAVDQQITLKYNGKNVWIAKTNNEGKAELWVDLFQKSETIDLAKLQIEVGTKTITGVKTFESGINTITLTSNVSKPNKVELAFVVDATGSMGDELEYLKTELKDVISRAKADNPSVSLLTGSVFYRDEEDDYVTRISNFSSDINTTLDFIKKQSASGGGDFPEAVHTALDKAINDLQWSSTARTRIIFLLLDAPPHYETKIVSEIQNHLQTASEKGILIIPITASGIDKETEFLMRFMAVITNGTYVFITNDSGIGGEHIKPTVGKYQVEFLNNLMLRLINKYSKTE